jgi:hypothetical protein
MAVVASTRTLRLSAREAPVSNIALRGAPTVLNRPDPYKKQAAYLELLDARDFTSIEEDRWQLAKAYFFVRRTNRHDPLRYNRDVTEDMSDFFVSGRGDSADELAEIESGLSILRERAEYQLDQNPKKNINYVDVENTFDEMDHLHGEG